MDKDRLGIIVQGPLVTATDGSSTEDILRAINQFPQRDRFIVCLSVWDTELAALVDTLTPLVDRVVICHPPARAGANSRNYQAYAVSRALETLEEETAYVLKTRPDIWLTDKFLTRLLDFAQSGSQKILVTNFFTRYESFHVSDMVMFSRWENLRDWFDEVPVFYEDLFSAEVQFCRTFIRNNQLDYSHRLEHYLRFLKDWIELVDFSDEGLIWFKNRTLTPRLYNRQQVLLHDRDSGPVLTRLVTPRFHRSLQTLRFGMRTVATSLLVRDALMRFVVNLLPQWFHPSYYTLERTGPEHHKPVRPLPPPPPKGPTVAEMQRITTAQQRVGEKSL